MSSYYQAVKYGPISIGLPVLNNHLLEYTFGYGRTVTVVYNSDELKNDDVIPKQTSERVKEWLIAEWEDKVLVDESTTKFDMFKTLREVEFIDLAIMPPKYDSSLKSACHYLYDEINNFVQLNTVGRSWVVEVEIIEQRESYGYKIDRYTGP